MLDVFLRRVEQDPLSAGLRVVAGPCFQSLGLPQQQIAGDAADLRKQVLVSDADRDGVQLYRLFAVDPDGPAFEADRRVIQAAVRTAGEARDAVDDARTQAEASQNRVDATPLARLAQRYVDHERRHMYLIAASFLGSDEISGEEFLRRLATDAHQISTEDLRVLLDSNNWQHRLTAAWLAAVDRRAALRGDIAEHLYAEDMVGPVQGYSIALASFGTPHDAEILATYLDRVLSHGGLDQPWALGALLHLDAQLSTTNAARFLSPGGAWHQWCQALRLDPADNDPSAEQGRVAQLLALITDASANSR
jgi:hypothetical protein